MSDTVAGEHVLILVKSDHRGRIAEVVASLEKQGLRNAQVVDGTAGIVSGVVDPGQRAALQRVAGVESVVPQGARGVDPYFHKGASPPAQETPPEPPRPPSERKSVEVPSQPKKKRF